MELRNFHLSMKSRKEGPGTGGQAFTTQCGVLSLVGLVCALLGPLMFHLRIVHHYHISYACLGSSAGA